MDSRNDWKRVTKPEIPSRSGKYGNEPQSIRDGNKSSRRQYTTSYNAAGNRGYRDDNYGNRMNDPNYNYEQGDDAGYNSGYIDLNSAVDSVPTKKKRKRIVKETSVSSSSSIISSESSSESSSRNEPVNRSYQKVILKKKVPKKTLTLPKKKVKPIVPAYPDIVFDKPVRLNRFIANTGLCSRREADEHIKGGLIKVNGEVVTEMGVKVNPGDEIQFKDNELTNQRKIYLLLNKPKGFITSMDDPNGKKIVMDLVRSACKERIFPVGRLDKMTTGVLLLTNDGDLSLKLTHPSNRMRKVYQIKLDKPLVEEDLEKLAKGIELEDGPIAFDTIAYTDPENKSQIGAEIHSGKNRIVRRMFESVGYKVMKLDRVYFAGLTRKGLKRGKWRFLTPEEVAFLKMMPS